MRKEIWSGGGDQLLFVCTEDSVVPELTMGLELRERPLNA